MKRVKRGGRYTKLPPNTKSIMRPSRWQNPFVLIEHGGPYTREESLRLFREYLDERPELVAEARRVLTGFALACECELTEECHGDEWIRRLLP